MWISGLVYVRWVFCFGDAIVHSESQANVVAVGFLVETE